jgi:chromosome segregation ATPase
MKPLNQALSMKRNILTFLMLGACFLFAGRTAPAADQTQTIETQLRERLRDTTLQLRDAETERAALQAAQTQLTDENKALSERIEAITKVADANKVAAQTAAQAVDNLKARVSHQDTEIAQLTEDGQSCQQAAELARNKATEQIKLADEAVIELERLVTDRQAKNLALYKIANEILQRYQKFGLGDALTAREPFVGITRVKLQNLVQDYQDKIQNERVTLSEKDLPAYGDKLLRQPRQTSESGSGPPGHTAE